MSRRSERGFSLVELLVAVVILATGSLILVSGSLFVTRDLFRSRQSTVAAAAVQARLDRLRVAAMSTATPCGSSQFSSSAFPDTVGNVSIQWVVPATGALRNVRVISSYKLNNGRTRTDTIVGGIAC